MTGVVSQCQWGPIIPAKSALGTEQEHMIAGKQSGIPPHTGILGESKHIATGAVEKHFIRIRKGSAVCGDLAPDGENFLQRMDSARFPGPENLYKTLEIHAFLRRPLKTL